MGTKIEKKEKEVKSEKKLFDRKPSILPQADYLVNDWGKIHKKPNPIVTLKDIPILSEGTILSIKAEAKAGKTSHLEAIISSHLAKNNILDSLGYKTNLNGYRQKILFVDTEQSAFESQNSYNRIVRRCLFDTKLDKPSELDNLIHVNFKSLDTDEKYTILIKFLEKNDDIGIIILDVVTDFAEDIMEYKDARKFISIINRLNKEIGIIVTIHTNQGSQNNKARGHIGSELERKSSCVLELKKGSDINYVNITHNRIGNEEKEVITYVYSSEHNLFVQAERKHSIDEEKAKRELILSKLNQIYLNTTSLRRVDFIERYSANFNVGHQAGRKFFDKCLNENLIKKDGKYYIFNSVPK